MSSHETIVFEDSFTVEGRTFKNAGYVSGQVKTLLQNMKFSQEIIRRAAIVTYEAEINICSYADRGRIILRVTPKEIIIEAMDEGPGIADIELAMKEGYSTATENIFHMGFGAGMGLSNIKHYSDVFHIISEVGKGTHLKMIIRTA
jgi:serine/threonine-protein kinase RsbT